MNEDASLRLTLPWQAIATWAHPSETKRKNPSPGESAVSQLLFTPDSRRLVVIPTWPATRPPFFTVPEEPWLRGWHFRSISGDMAFLDPATIFAFFGGHATTFWEAAQSAGRARAGEAGLPYIPSLARANDGIHSGSYPAGGCWRKLRPGRDERNALSRRAEKILPVSG